MAHTGAERAADSAAIEAANEGARKILARCLGLRHCESLCFFFDETTEQVAELVLRSAAELNLWVTKFRVPLADQRRYSAGVAIPSEFQTALQDSRGILTCLAADTQSTGFRRELLKQGVNEGTRFGHMPGANIQLFATAANIDYEEAAQRCEQIAYAMDVGCRAELKTFEFDKEGCTVQEHSLMMDMGGSKRNPITSTGIIPAHTWGNIPGGETFIAPIEDTAEGSFVLNGSLNGRICEPGEQIVVEFRKGRVAQAPIGNRSLREYFLAMIQPALDTGDEFADCLAELGVGVNMGVRELTGTALIDEKCAGTAHIAVGDNARYGGRHGSNIHEDLITRAPSLFIDGKSILEAGTYCFRVDDCFESLEEMALRPEFSNQLLRVRQKTGVAVDTHDGLRVVRLVANERRGRYRISLEQDSEIILATVWNALPFAPQVVAFEQAYRTLAERAEPPSKRVVRAALQVLHDRGLVGSAPIGGGARA